MKQFKLAVLLCLVFLLAFAVVACGEDTSTTEATSGTATTTTIPTTQTTTAPVSTTTVAVPVTTAPETTAPETTAPVTTAPMTTAPVTTTPVTTTPVTTEGVHTIKIGETPLSEYTIIYAKSKYTRYVNTPDYKPYFPVYDFDRETAERVSDLLFSLTGVRLSVAQDIETDETANEILIGKTNRKFSSFSLNNLTTDDFVISVQGSKLVVCGGEYRQKSGLRLRKGA